MVKQSGKNFGGFCLFVLYKNFYYYGQIWPLILALRRQRQTELCEFEAGLAYIVEFQASQETSQKTNIIIIISITIIIILCVCIKYV